MTKDTLPSNVFFPARFVYLAGPILGCNFGEANDWRTAVAEKLRPHGIIGISPLRCEPLHGEVYSTDYPDPCFGTPRAIAAKNKFDVHNCDLTLALLPKPPAGRSPSLGTLHEIAWADEAGKMVIQVTDDPTVINHPVVDSGRGWKMVTTLTDAPTGVTFKTIEECMDAALRTIIGVLGGYTGGKNV